MDEPMMTSGDDAKLDYATPGRRRRPIFVYVVGWAAVVLLSLAVLSWWLMGILPPRQRATPPQTAPTAADRPG